jgi:predicted transposase YbfD/YdcC
MQASESADSPLLLVIHHFAALPDPRMDRTQRHALVSILLVTFAAVLAGADGWDEIAEFGRVRVDWLRQLVPMPQGSPSADVLRRVFSALKPHAFEACFRRWVASLSDDLQDEVVAIDGKTVRGSANAASERSALRLVHVWASHQKLLLGQCAAKGAPGEPRVVPPLLDALSVEGAVITLDANGCTKAIAEAIVANKAHYVLHLKGNRGPVHAHVAAQFDTDVDAALDAGQVQVDRQSERGHGRAEQRVVWAAAPKLPTNIAEAWPGLASVARIDRERTVDGRTTRERHYFLSSLPPDASRLGNAARAHWSVENHLHWSLDVALGEEDSRIRQGFGAQNFALIRRIALTLLKRPEAGKQSVPIKRKRAGWDPAYLRKLLNLGVPSS